MGTRRPDQGRDWGLRDGWKPLYSEFGGVITIGRNWRSDVHMNSRITGHELSIKLEMSRPISAVEPDSLV